MANAVLKHYVGDLFAGDMGLGFLVRDCRGDTGDPIITEATARAIVAAMDESPNVAIGPVHLLEISEAEFEFYRDAAMEIPSLPEGLTLFQVKR